MSINNIPIYVVNIKEPKNYKELLSNSLEKFGLLENAFFLDTNRFECLEYNEKYFWDNMYSNRYNYLDNPHMAGCLSSHYKIWNMILENKDDYALIFEEDVLFEENFIEYFNNLELPNDFDILYLGGNYIEKTIPEKSGIYIKEVNKGAAFTNESYIVSRKCVIKLIDLISENYYFNNKGEMGFYNTDYYIELLFRKSLLNIHYLSPFICYQAKFRTSKGLNI